MVKGPERRKERFTIRLPTSLREQIKKAAERARRSPSDWIVLKLEEAIVAEASKGFDPTAFLKVVLAEAAKVKK